MVDEKDNKEIVIDDGGKRSFLGPEEDNVYYVIPPDTENIRGADWNYSKMFTKCLLEGITTAAEMVEILKRRGIIGPEFEQRAIELTEVLNEKITALETATGNDEKTDLAIGIANAREDLFQWNQRLNGPMSNTCEQMADDARLEYLTSCMVTDIDGNILFFSGSFIFGGNMHNTIGINIKTNFNLRYTTRCWRQTCCRHSKSAERTIHGSHRD